eukprot:EG_transcript_21592
MAAVNGVLAAHYGPAARNATAVDFAPLSLREQMLAMLHTDILIMVHGGVYGNTIFLPPNSIVIDIYPYAFHPEQHGYHINGIHLSMPSMHYGQLLLETDDPSTTLVMGGVCYVGPCSGLNTTAPSGELHSTNELFLAFLSCAAPQVRCIRRCAWWWTPHGWPRGFGKRCWRGGRRSPAQPSPAPRRRGRRRRCTRRPRPPPSSASAVRNSRLPITRRCGRRATSAAPVTRPSSSGSSPGATARCRWAVVRRRRRACPVMAHRSYPSPPPPASLDRLTAVLPAEAYAGFSNTTRHPVQANPPAPAT